MHIRKATIEELDKIMEIYAFARTFMAEHGNPTQWGQNKPAREQIEHDILTEKCHVCMVDDKIAGVFYFAKEEDATYTNIYEGNWLNEEAYAVVHRVASAGIARGVGSFCMNWASEQCENLKIDTHKDNYVMQNMLKKCGFVHCGIIYLEDGEPRLAFQKVCKK